MNIPEHLMTDLESLGYKRLSRLDYDSKLEKLEIEREKLMALRAWAESHKEPVDGWIEFYFSYLERMTADIDVRSNYLWTSFYQLESVLRGFILVMMWQETDKAAKVTEFGNRYNEWIRQTTHGAIVAGYFANILLDYSNSRKARWMLKDNETMALFPVYVSWMDTFSALQEKTVGTEAISRLKFAVKMLMQEVENSDYRDIKSDLLLQVRDRIALFQLAVFDEQAYMAMEDYVEEVYKAKKLPGKIAFPEAVQLLEQGKQLFGENRQLAVLYLLLDNFLKSLAVGLKNMKALHEHQASGANIHNVAGFSSFSQFLQHIQIYEKETEAISTYLSEYLKKEDALVMLSAIVAHDYYTLMEQYPERGELIRKLVFNLVDLESETPGQTGIKKLCVRWGLLKKEVLPIKDRFKAPKKLPSNLKELEAFYKQLKIKKAFKFNKKALEKDLPAGLPAEISEIYLAFNGTADEESFVKISEAKSLKEVILDSLKSDAEDSEGEDLYFDEADREVDVRQFAHEGIIPIGTSASGDMYFADPKHLSVTGNAIVIMYRHDQYLSGRLEANSLAEFIGRLMIDRYISVNGPDEDLIKLLDTEIRLA